MAKQMRLDEYQDGAVSTSIIPKKLSLVYPALGLCGEIGELTEKISSKKPGTVEEIGDVLWYVANIANDTGFTLSEVCKRKTFPKNNKALWCTDDMLQELSIRAGIVCECVKKTFRDDKGVLNDERKGKIKVALRHIMAVLAEIADHANCLLVECAEKNLQKLQSRKKRSVLKGDGDNR